MALYGYCQGGCIDNAINSPTFNNPPQLFGFTVDGGMDFAMVMLVLLIPNNESLASIVVGGMGVNPANFYLVGAWTTGNLNTVVGIDTVPTNPIGAFIPNSQLYNPGMTGYDVYIANMMASFYDHMYPNTSPLMYLSGPLPVGSYILALASVGDVVWTATANTGAIFIMAQVAPQRGIAWNDLVIRNADKLSVQGFKPKGVAVAGNVVYRTQ